MHAKAARSACAISVREWSRSSLQSKAGMQRLCLCLASAALAAGMPCVLKREAGIRCDGTVDDTNSFQTLLNNCSTVTVTTDAHCVTLPVQMPSHSTMCRKCFVC